jgi:hypothetical protein
MLFPTLILVPVQCEHDRLQQSIDFRKRDEPTECGNVSRLRLQQEEEVAILLCPPIDSVSSSVDATSDCCAPRRRVSRLALRSESQSVCSVLTHLIQRHAIRDEQRDSAIEITHIPLQHEVLLRLCRDSPFQLPQSLLGCKETNKQNQRAVHVASSRGEVFRAGWRGKAMRS